MVLSFYEVCESSKEAKKYKKVIRMHIFPDIDLAIMSNELIINGGLRSPYLSDGMPLRYVVKKN